MLQIEPLTIDVFKMAKVGGNHFERVGPNRHSAERSGIDLADEAGSRTLSPRLCLLSHRAA